MEIFIVVWLLSAILAAIVASSKNRPVGAWAIGGILLGPLAVLMVAVMPSLDPNAPKPPAIRAPRSKDPFRH